LLEAVARDGADAIPLAVTLAELVLRDAQAEEAPEPRSAKGGPS